MMKADTYQPVNSVHLVLRSRAWFVTFCLLAVTVSPSVFAQSRTQVVRNPTSFTSVPLNLLLQIVRAEDERRWDNDVRSLLSARSAVVRKRAALAAGRIGREEAVSDLINLLQHDDEMDVRSMAAFAIGEVESALAADVVLEVLGSSKEPQVRARAVEALGKIAAALPKEQEARARQLGNGILEALKVEIERPAPDRLTVLLGLTAALRAKTSNGGPTIARFLAASDARIRADAANTLARLRLKDGNDQLRKLLKSDPDPVVRANAARVLGGTEDKGAFDGLLDRALHDPDARVRVSAIRGLTSLKDDRAGRPLLERGEQLLAAVQKGTGLPAVINEMLELATSIGRLLANSKNDQAVRWLRQSRSKLGLAFPEIEVAFARVSPQLYQMAASASLVPARMSNPNANPEDASVYVGANWVRWASVAQGLGELALVKSGNRILDTSIKEESERMLRSSAACPPNAVPYRKFKPRSGVLVGTVCVPTPRQAVPDFLRGLAAFKPKDLDQVLRKQLKESDVIIRATAAELLGELPPDSTNTEALSEALKTALSDKVLNDASLATIDALAKQKNKNANLAIEAALASSDQLIRRKAVASLKANGAGDFSARVGSVQTRNANADYARAIARIGKPVQAVILTTKGAFTIELLPEDATLTVDNFVQLAKRNYFNGITVHRVVPNFVIQDGDPRGDGNGGPGYQIRCEINEVPYERGAIGMALSGKDTGGSQWFATHSPQPHLDGGYTVFGRVIRGMDVVDSIVRGDVIRSIKITETFRRPLTRPR
jgi:cyclophilin family peptidyl-prolyl cis-trans isomerase/HEAT repeat protein